MSKEKAALACLSLSTLSLGISSYMVAGLIPLMSADFSVSIAWAAQSVAAFTFAYGLLSPVAVSITARRDLRRNILLYLGVFVIANIVSALTSDFWLFLLSRMIEGISAGAFLACGITASARLSAADKQGKSISVIMAGMAIGTVIGVPLSLSIAQIYGWRNAIFLVAFIAAVAWLGLFLALAPMADNAKPNQGSRFALLADYRVLRILLVSWFIAIASLGMYSFLAPFVKAMQSAASIPFYLWFWGAGGVLGSITVGYIVDKISAKMIIGAILAILILAFIAMRWLADINLVLIAVPLIFWGAAGWALQVPQNNELLKLRKAAGDGNLAVGLNQSSVYLGGAVGAVCGGLLLSHGIGAAALPLIFIAPLAAAVILLFIPPQKT